jgi:hypothetical protein
LEGGGEEDIERFDKAIVSLSPGQGISRHFTGAGQGEHTRYAKSIKNKDSPARPEQP